MIRNIRTGRWTTWLLVVAIAAGMAHGPRAARAGSSAKKRTEQARAQVRLLAEFRAGATVGERTQDQLRADATKVVDLLLEALANSGRSRHKSALALSNIEQTCSRSVRADDDRVRRAVMLALAEALASDANRPAGVQAIAAQMICNYGGDECIEPLSGLLTSDSLARRERARGALEAINTPATGNKLRQALFSAVDPNQQIGLINSLAAQGEPKSISWIARMLKDRHPAVAKAAAAALGDIGSAEAIGVLSQSHLLASGELRLAVCDAMLACAENAARTGETATAVGIWRKLYENPTELTPVRVAALRATVVARKERAVGIVIDLLAGKDRQIRPIALALAREIPGPAATKALVELLGQATDEASKIELIDVLGQRGDPAARLAVVSALRGRRWHNGATGELRKAIIRAVGGIGNEADAMMLVRLAVQSGEKAEQERDLARAGVLRLRGEKINAALIAGLAENDPAVRREVIRALAGRGATEATDALLNLRADTESRVRHTALWGLGQVGDETALLPLVRWFCATPDSGEASACQRAMIDICQRTDAQDVAAASIAKAFPDADIKARCALMQSAGRLASPKALETLVLGLADPNEIVQETAIKAMSHSPQPGAAEHLLHVARTAKRKDRKALALSGYIRLSYYLPLPAEKKIWAYIQVMELAETAEQRERAVKCLGEIRSAGALALAAENIENPELSDEAQAATCRIAARIYSSNPQEVLNAMTRIISYTASTERLKEARRIRDLAQKALDKRKDKS